MLTVFKTSLCPEESIFWRIDEKSLWIMHVCATVEEFLSKHINQILLKYCSYLVKWKSFYNFAVISHGAEHFYTIIHLQMVIFRAAQRASSYNSFSSFVLILYLKLLQTDGISKSTASCVLYIVTYFLDFKDYAYKTDVSLECVNLITLPKR